MTIYESKQLNRHEYPSLALMCHCDGAEHHATLIWDDEYRLLYLTVHLIRFRFWKRLWYAIKYVFGRASRYGDYAEIVLTPEDAAYMSSWLHTRVLLSGLGRR